METENIKSRNDFIDFVESLHRDFLLNGSTWENGDLGSFLAAMAAYASDLQGFYNNNYGNISADIPTWRAFADILAGAEIYE